MNTTAHNFLRDGSPGKKALDPSLTAGSRGTVDDVRVRTGYPVWNLIGTWIAAHYDDDAVLAGYTDMPREEWEAAKRYYLDHKIIFDAKLIVNSQPAADDDVPRMQTVDEYFAWLERTSASNTSDGANGSLAHG